MTWFDHSRRAVSVVLVAVSLIIVPAMASATFTGRQVASLDVGTDRMETPSAIVGTWRCINGPNHEGFSFTTTNFTDNGPANPTYLYSISRGSTVISTTTSWNKGMTVTTPNQSKDNRATTWTISIQTTLGQWTGTPFTKNVNCSNGSTASGSI
jgi:hypothetical protein